MALFLLPNKKTRSYWIALKWFFIQLEVTGNRLATKCELAGHMDMEKGLRNASQVLLKLFGYILAFIMNDTFHLNQLKFKYIKQFGLQGAYTFSKKGDKNYFNYFRLAFEFVMCLELVSVDGVRKLRVILRDITIKSIDSLDFQSMKSTKTSVKAGTKRWWKWYLHTFGDGCQYSLEETNSFMHDERTNNKLESMHNKLERLTGKHPPIDEFAKGVAKMENDYVLDYLSHNNRNDKPTLNKKEQIVHDRMHMVWDVIRAKELEAKNNRTDIGADWYMQRLVELHDIYYEFRKRGCSYIDWDNYSP